MSANNGLPCRNCGVNDWSKDGKCRKCKSERDRIYRENNREKVLTRKRQYRLNNPEKVRISYLRWLENNRDKKSEADRQWALANRDKIKANHLRWRSQDVNKIIVSTNSKMWRKSNRERAREQERLWRIENRDCARAIVRRRRARKLQAPGIGITGKQEEQLRDEYCNLCAYCGERKPLELDHIEPLARGGAHDIRNATVACKSCNSSKGKKPLLIFMYSRSLDTVR